MTSASILGTHRDSVLSGLVAESSLSDPRIFSSKRGVSPHGDFGRSWGALVKENRLEFAGACQLHEGFVKAPGAQEVRRILAAAEKIKTPKFLCFRFLWGDSLAFLGAPSDRFGTNLFFPLGFEPPDFHLRFRACFQCLDYMLGCPVHNARWRQIL